jgi:MFS family permease
VVFTAAFFIALFVQGFMVSAMTVMQLEVPDQLRGRVMGLQTMGYSLVPLGGLFLGALANRYSGVFALVVGASLFLVSVLVVSMIKTHIRDLDGRTYSSDP